MPTIIDIRAREVFDSRADITLEVEVVLNSGKRGRSIIPTGCSKGKYEALEVRDNDPKRFNGQGVLRAIEIVHTQIKPRLLGMSPYAQEEIDGLFI